MYDIEEAKRRLAEKRSQSNMVTKPAASLSSGYKPRTVQLAPGGSYGPGAEKAFQESEAENRMRNLTWTRSMWDEENKRTREKSDVIGMESERMKAEGRKRKEDKLRDWLRSSYPEGPVLEYEVQRRMR